jgi:hypothetical protein
LREGGSLPALAEADDDFKYVLKFKGAGHGVKPRRIDRREIARVLKLQIPGWCMQISMKLLVVPKPTRKSKIYARSQGFNLAHFLSVPSILIQ